MAQATPAPRRVVAGVDTSDNAACAAAWAAREAADRGLPLRLVHALDLAASATGRVEPAGFAEFRRDEGAQLLARRAEQLRGRFPELVIDTEVSEFGAAQTLVTLSGEADLVVTGTRGHGGFAGLLLGSVSLTLAAHARGPAVVVRGEQPGDPLSEIVLGIGPDEDEAPIRFAFATAAVLGATVRMVRAWRPQPVYPGYRVEDVDITASTHAAQAATLTKGVRAAYPSVRATLDVMRGNAVPTLIEAARGSRLLVVGARRRRGLLSVGAGYVVQGLLSYSPTPVAIVPIA